MFFLVVHKIMVFLTVDSDSALMTFDAVRFEWYIFKCHRYRQVSRGSAGEYQADEHQVSRGSAGEYQADEQAGVVRLRWRLLGR